MVIKVHGICGCDDELLRANKRATKDASHTCAQVAYQYDKTSSTTLLMWVCLFGKELL
jgi:hypothetical protein